MRWLLLLALPLFLKAELPHFENLPEGAVGSYRYSVIFRPVRAVLNTAKKRWVHTLEIYTRFPQPKAPVPNGRYMRFESQKAEIFPSTGGLFYGECFMIDAKTFSDCAFPKERQGTESFYLK